ncbi:AAA family ATPase [soil metagenome]
MYIKTCNCSTFPTLLNNLYKTAMQIDNLQIKNFKCFDEEGCTIDHLKSINVIIGKNNSGKSSLIELFRFLTDGDKSFFQQKRKGKSPEIILHHVMSKDLIEPSFPKNTAGGDIGGNHFVYGLTFENANLVYGVHPKHKKEFIKVDREFKSGAKQYFDSYVNRLPIPLQGRIFSHLSAERDILPESANSQLNLSTTGIGATNFIQQIINRNSYDSELIEKTLLKELNEILNPDIFFDRILVQQNDEDIWEIYFENSEDGRIPLSKMGSGVKTVLLVLLHLFVKPVIQKKGVEQYVFAFEELENNLHPSMQRRLYYYLYSFSKKTNSIIFLTTHSNVVIDLYNSLPDTQIFHINKIDGKTVLNSTIKQSEFKKILDDLDVRASDILQSNGIIWVEGPSDRTYINKWISLLDKKLIEGYHYLIMFYGGRLLSNLSFEYDLINTDLIPLLKLNTNSFVLMDRDGKTISSKLNETKIRIQEELGVNSVWITKGREIENYLSSNSLNKWFSNIHNIQLTFDNESDTKLEESISRHANAGKIKYNQNKNKYASEIVDFIEIEDLDVLDLKINIQRLIQEIGKWNRQ